MTCLDNKYLSDLYKFYLFLFTPHFLLSVASMAIEHRRCFRRMLT